MSTWPVDKNAVARNFSQAAATYDAWAVAQAQIVSELALRLPASLKPALMVDLGCGTGGLCDLLVRRYPEASLVGVDLAPGMVEACRRRWAACDRMRFVAGDAESLIIDGASLVACASSAQWFARPEQTLMRWACSLAPGGVLAIAMLVAGSCYELVDAYQRGVGHEMTGLAFAPETMLPRIAGRASLRVLRNDLAAVSAMYADVHAALRSFRHTGAILRGQADSEPLPPAAMRRLLAAYHDHARPDGVPVTFRVQYFIAEKIA
jgi:malonyl-CoA O-methyltransferase